MLILLIWYFKRGIE